MVRRWRQAAALLQRHPLPLRLSLGGLACRRTTPGGRRRAARRRSTQRLRGKHSRSSVSRSATESSGQRRRRGRRRRSDGGRGAAARHYDVDIAVSARSGARARRRQVALPTLIASRHCALPRTLLSADIALDGRSGRLEEQLAHAPRSPDPRCAHCGRLDPVLGIGGPPIRPRRSVMNNPPRTRVPAEPAVRRRQLRNHGRGEPRDCSDPLAGVIGEYRARNREHAAPHLLPIPGLAPANRGFSCASLRIALIRSPLQRPEFALVLGLWS